MSAPSVPVIEARPYPSSATSIVFYWGPPTSDGGSPITKYTLACSAISFSQDISANQSAYEVTGLTAGTEYQFTLTATNTNGTGPAATYISVQPGVTPFGPTLATVSTLNESTALVTWNLSTIANEGAPKWFVITVYPSTTSMSSYEKSSYIFERARTLQMPSTNIFYRYLVQAVNDADYCIPFAFTSTLGFGITGGGGGAFSPSSFAGLSFWLDASQLGSNYSNNAALSGVVDLTSNALFGGAISSPTYVTSAIGGNGAIRFQSASNHYINFGNHLNPGTTPQAIMAVARYSTTADGHIIAKSIFAAAPARWAFGRDNTTANPPGFVYFFQTSGSTLNASFSDTNTSTQLIAGNWNRSTIQLHRYGSTAQIVSAADWGTVSSLYPLLVGAYNNGSGGVPPQPGLFFNGDLGEILVFNSNLSQYNRQRFEGYLAWKWGLSENLPVTHPFRGGTPNATEARFLPNQIDGLELWLDAADTATFTVSGVSSVAGWADKSPYQKRTVVSATRPIITPGLNGLSSIRFTAASQTFVSTAFLSAPGTEDFMMFAVWRPTVSSTYNPIVGIGTNAQASGNIALLYGTAAANSYQLDDYNNGTVGTSSLVNDWSIQSGGRYGASLHTWHNGAYQRSVIFGTSTVSTNITGSNIFVGTASAAYASADLAEALVYRGTVTPFEKQKIEGYLAWKWGLQSSLAQTHPFRSAAPTPSTIFSPTLFSSIRAWYDGADPGGNGVLPASGSTIGVWVDKSPASNNATAVTSARYISDYPRGYLDFNAASNTHYTLSNGNFFANQYYTTFIVERLQSTLSGTERQTLLGGSNTAASTNFLVQYSGSNLSTFLVDYNANTLSTVSTPSYTFTYMQPTRIWTITQRTSNWAIMLNGSTIRANTNNILPTSWLGATIGRNPAVSGANYTGQLKEILYYVGEMDPNDRQTFEGYLAWKWDQEQVLPQPSGRHNYRYFNVNTSTGTAVFDPRSIGDLRTWLDASDPANFDLIGTSSIVRWLDKSDYKNHYSTQNASSLTRIVDGGRPAVFFTGSNGMNAVNPFYATINGTIAFIIAKVDSTPSIVNMFTWGDAIGNEVGVRYGNSNLPQLNGGPGIGGGNQNDWGANAYSVNGSSNISTTSTTYTTYHLVDAVYVQPSIGLSNTWALGYSPFYARRFIGKVCELIVYQSSLTVADRQRVQGYLAWKWGLQNTFPLDHPYRYVNIYQSTLTPNDVPRQMPGLTLWMDGADASTITQTTSSITQWRDKSGFGNDLVQLSSIAQPLMIGSNYVRFNLGRHFDIPQRAVNNAPTYTMVFQFIPVSTTNFLLSKQHDGFNTYNVLSMTSTINPFGSGPTVGAMYWKTSNAGAQLSTSVAIAPLGSSILMSLDFDGTTANFFRFGSSIGSFANAAFTIPAVTNATNFKMGALIASSGVPPSSISDFQMGEFIFYNSTVGTFQRQRLEGYLAWKWGTQAQLPTTHPFFSRAP